MPYTPPSQRSPATSRPDSPPRSRDGSWVKPLPESSPFLTGPRPGLPRSSSSTAYLHRHRRSPSSPETTRSYSSPIHNQTARHAVAPTWHQAPNASLRQSPPPLNNLTIPTGAVMSPPDSASNSSDDEGLVMPERGRKLENLAELQAAISVIERQRESSPSLKQAEVSAARNTLGLEGNVTESTTTLQLSSAARPPLSKEARKISHSRSATEPDVYLERSPAYSPVASSSDSELDDETAARKPPMLRKKSGELVRPALRPPSARRRPSSMPGTPTFSKAVHFSNDLEHVRHFLQVDRPLAVSAETSPVETHDTETEFPFDDEEVSRSPTYEWEINCANFPAVRTETKAAPVVVERVFLSPDKKTLIGTAAVQNLAFQKLIIARFTFDYWKTTSEVTAEFSHDVRRERAADGLDRFNFNIRLADQVNLQSKTLFFCVRYVVNGQEFWDSNEMMNFQVDFSKKQISTPAKKKHSAGNEATRHIKGLPRSHHSPQQSPNRKTFDDFGRGIDVHWDNDLLPRSQSALSILTDTESTPLKFRSKAAGNSLEDRRPSKGAGQAFAHRYNFGASLSAAITAASTALGDRSGLPQQASSPQQKTESVQPASNKEETAAVLLPVSKASPPPAAATPTQEPQTPASSLSYNELLEKYCFFGSAKPSPIVKLESGKGKGEAVDDFDFGKSTSSSTPSPVRSPAADKIQAAATESERVHTPVSPSRSELSSRAVSPNSFGYPYHQPLINGFAPSTAIRG